MYSCIVDDNIGFKMSKLAFLLYVFCNDYIVMYVNKYLYVSNGI